jgi:hypothetical protein
MKLHETTPNMSFGPRVVDWAFKACSLQKMKISFWWQNSCFECTMIPIFRMGDVRQRNCAKPPEREFWLGMFVAKNEKWFQWQKLMLWMHHDTRFQNGWRAVTNLQETTPKHQFWTSSTGLGMFDVKNDEMVPVAKTHALNVLWYPFSEWVTCGNKIELSHP